MKSAMVSGSALPVQSKFHCLGITVETAQSQCLEYCSTSRNCQVGFQTELLCGLENITTQGVLGHPATVCGVLVEWLKVKTLSSSPSTAKKKKKNHRSNNAPQTLREPRAGKVQN
jgi:hypothetical protein